MMRPTRVSGTGSLEVYADRQLAAQTCARVEQRARLGTNQSHIRTRLPTTILPKETIIASSAHPSTMGATVHKNKKQDDDPDARDANAKK